MVCILLIMAGDRKSSSAMVPPKNALESI
jgi:hypothetical protein